MLIVDLSAAVDEGSNVKTFNLQADFEFNFLSMGIAHSAPVRNIDYLFKHLDNSVDEDDDSDVKPCQQILKHSIATLTFAFRIDFIRRNFSKAN